MGSKLVWSGEHWILYLRRPGEAENTGSVSLYHTSYSAAGEGTVAFARSHEFGLEPTLFAENNALAEFVVENVVAWGASPFERDTPIVEARFKRGGDVRSAPTWRIEAGDDVVQAEWSHLEPEVVMDKPLESGVVTVVHSVLFFGAAAAMRVNGRLVEGEPFVRESWRRAIGRPGSSCCFALAETLVSSDQAG